MAGDDFDICVIGAGAGGLVVASGAAMMGARVVLVKQEAQAALQDVRCGRLTWGCNGR